MPSLRPLLVVVVFAGACGEVSEGPLVRSHPHVGGADPNEDQDQRLERHPDQLRRVQQACRQEQGALGVIRGLIWLSLSLSSVQIKLHNTNKTKHKNIQQCFGGVSCLCNFVISLFRSGDDRI